MTQKRGCPDFQLYAVRLQILHATEGHGLIRTNEAERSQGEP